MHGRFLGGDKTRAHVHAVRAQGQGRHETAAIRHAAGGDKRDLELVGRARQQNEIGNVIFAGVAAALEAVDAHGVAADGLGFQGMTHRRAFVDHLDARRLERCQVRFGIAARRLDNPDTAFDDRADVFGIRRRSERRQEREIHAEGRSVISRQRRFPSPAIQASAASAR